MAAVISFGDWIRQRRRQLDLTQDQLASHIGCSKATIRKIEADERRPSRQIAELLAVHLQIPPDEQATFLKVARLDLRIDALANMTALTDVTTGPNRAALPLTTPSVTTRAAHLPVPPTPFFGRSAELDHLQQLLASPECRLLTLVGPGGVGKTRLALAAAAAQTPHFAHGVYFLSLASLSAASLLAPAIANAIGTTLNGAGEPTVQLLQALEHQQMLLVLDNLEHLLDDVSLLPALLQQTAAIKLLVTSRTPVQVQGEWIFELQGLPVPALSMPALPTTEKIDASLNRMGQWEGDYSALALFAERARRLVPTFVLSQENQAAVAQICHLVEGMPLALELAAAWVPLLSCAEIAQEIARNLDFLSTNLRDLPARHRSVRATFDYSWQLLSPTERKALGQLAVFQGGFTRQAAQAVGVALPQLARLVEHSLARRTEEGRYTIHELVRQYSTSKLAEQGPQAHQQAQAKHLAFYLQLALTFEAEVYGEALTTWLNRIEQENGNLRAALTFALDHAIEKALRLTTALCDYWFHRSLHEGRNWMQQVLAKAATQASTLSPQIYANALLKATHFNWDYNENEKMARTALALAQEVNDEQLIAEALRSVAANIWQSGRMAEATELFAESIRRFTQLGNHNERYDALSLYATALYYQGDLRQTLIVADQALQVARQSKSPMLLAHALGVCSNVYFYLGEVRQAHTLLLESVASFQNLGSRPGEAVALGYLGQALAYLGEFAASRQCLEQALRLLDQFELPEQRLITLFYLAERAYLLGDLAEASHYLARLQPMTKGDEWLRVVVAALAANLHRLRGDYAQAHLHLAAGQQLLTQTQVQRAHLALLQAQGLLALAEHDLAAAETYLTQCLRRAQAGGTRYGEIGALEGLAVLASLHEDSALAAERFAQAGALRIACGTPRPPVEEQTYTLLLGSVAWGG
jgi:predicted ATPase/transcriptional regulator with XRE-family HTH domain